MSVSRTLNVFVTPDGKIIGAGPMPLRGIPGFISYADAPTNFAISTPTIIPLQPLPSQLFHIMLNDQDCTIQLYFKEIWITLDETVFQEPPVYDHVIPLFMDLYVSNQQIIGGVLCLSNNLIVRNSYLGFIGDLGIIDTQPPIGRGPQNPQISGLGSRWLLTYWPDLSNQ